MKWFCGTEKFQYFSPFSYVFIDAILQQVGADTVHGYKAIFQMKNNV
jgi:uncharacterized membrane protein